MADFAGFDIEFDNYGSTNSPETRKSAPRSGRLRKAGLVEEKRSHATLRRPGRHVSGRPLRQGNLPEVQRRPTNTATVAKSAAPITARPT